MKILAFTDTHCSELAHIRIKKKIIKENPDLLISCGDLSNFSRGLESSAKFFNSFDKPCLIIPGNHETKEEKFEKFAKKFIPTIPKEKHLVFITHAPIYGTKLDDLWEEHRGCLSTLEFIEKTKPVLVLCGHFHENAGKQDKIKNTLVLNPGPSGKIINLE